jgi:hypothetical protein
MYRKITSIGLALSVCVACSAEFDGASPESLGQTEQALAGNFVPFAEAPLAGPIAFKGSSVRAILPVGQRVYVGGDFSFTSGSKTYKNLVAFDIPADPAASLTLATDFNPTPNGVVNALATDGSDRIFLGGEFTKVNGADYLWLTAVSTTNGAPTGFRADVSGSLDCKSCISGEPWNGQPGVKALLMVGWELVVGGNFTSVKDATGTSYARNGLAAIELMSETVDTSMFTKSVTEGYVSSLALDLLFNTVYVGGTFQTIEEEPRPCLASFYTDGTYKDVSFPKLTCPTAVDKDHYWGVRDIATDSMHARVYVAIGGKGTSGRVTPPTNTVFGYGDLGATYLWKSKTLGGDAQAVDYFRDVVYVGTHDGVFTSGTDGKNGDQYKIAGLDRDTGGFLVDRDHKDKTCDKDHTDNCWLPFSDAKGSRGGLWGVLDIAHYESDASRLFAGGFISHFGNVTNSKFFGAFRQMQ